MTAEERRALKSELRLLDSRIEALTKDYELKRADRDEFFHGAGRYGKSHVHNKGPRHRLAGRAQARLECAKDRMREIRGLLK